MIRLKTGCVENCPACHHRRLSMEESLHQKQQWLIKRIPAHANIISPVVSVAENQRWHYRKKVCLAAEYIGGKWNIGLRKRDEIIPIHQCPVHHELVNQTINLLCTRMPKPEEFPLAFFMQSGGQVTLVLKSKTLPKLGWLDQQAITHLQHNGVEGFWLHLHPSAGKKVTGKGGWHLVFGKPRSATADGLVYGPASFAQVLPELHVASLKMAFDFLKPDINSMVVDLYSGTGATLKRWHSAGAGCVGVELGGEAIECAAINVPQAILFRGTCSQRLPQVNIIAENARKQGKVLLLYVNPPRTGLEPAVTEWIATTLSPTRLAYLSCSAGTLQRDLGTLLQNGLRVIRIIPFDFFPQTLHLEMLALLGNQQP